MLMCVIAAVLFSGCYDVYLTLDPEDIIYFNSNWGYDIESYYYDIKHGQSKYKKIDLAHKKVFDSVFEDIEIFGAKLCVPMKVSELPDKFELYGYVSGDEYDLFAPDIEKVDESGWFPVSEIEPQGGRIIGGMEKYSLLLFYDNEIELASVKVICKEGQSIEDGIICRIDGYFPGQSLLLGGAVDIRSDISEIKEFLGEGNEYLWGYYGDYLDLIYTDGDRVINLTYSIDGEDMNFVCADIETVEMNILNTFNLY